MKFIKFMFNIERSLSRSLHLNKNNTCTPLFSTKNLRNLTFRASIFSGIVAPVYRYRTAPAGLHDSFNFSSSSGRDRHSLDRKGLNARSRRNKLLDMLVRLTLLPLQRHGSTTQCSIMKSCLLDIQFFGKIVLIEEAVVC